MKKSLVCMTLAFFASSAMFAQSAAKLSEIISTEKATCAQVSYLAAAYTNRITEDDTPQKAFEALSNDGCLPQHLSEDSEVSLGDVSYIFTKSLGISGGLFYTLFPSKRYAFKELKAKKILPQEADPSMAVSGRDSLDIFNDCTTLAEGAN